MLLQSVVELWEAIKRVVAEIWRALSDVMHCVMKKINPKVYHLAYHGSTARIRNKNKKRLWRWINELFC